MLIARPDNFVPKPEQISAFLAAMIQLRVVPEVEKICLSTPSSKVRTGTNPFTGETVSFPMNDFKYLQGVSEIPSAAKGISDYSVAVEGTGRPAVPPIPIDFADRYAIAIACRVSSVPRSTSDIYDDTQNQAQFNKPCLEPMPYGHFTDPNTHEILKVGDAGRAQFWVEFELGKWLFPSVENGNLEILHPTILERAESEFGIQFAQGCHYY